MRLRQGIYWYACFGRCYFYVAVIASVARQSYLSDYERQDCRVTSLLDGSIKPPFKINKKAGSASRNKECRNCNCKTDTECLGPACKKFGI